MSNLSNTYVTEVQWGGSSAPWHQNGQFVVGGRDAQRAVAVDIASKDGGKTFSGTMRYGKGNPDFPNGEGPIGFRATQTKGNEYATQVQWGGSSAPWHDNGTWTIGCRDDQRAVALDIASTDDGLSFSGTMIYANEGPIGFRSALVNGYRTEVQWGGSSAPWHQNGIFVLGGRDGQRAVGLHISSDDGGKSFSGTMRYGTGNPDFPQGEGKIGFKASLLHDNTYATQVQWGGSSAPWHDNGVFVIGGRSNQRAVKLETESSDDGKTFSGTMTYAGEGPIGFKAALALS